MRFSVVTTSVGRRLQWLLTAALVFSFFSGTLSASSKKTNAIIQGLVDEIKTTQDSLTTLKPPRPFVTLAFAQSLDGMIAAYYQDAESGNTTSNLGLSCKQSLQLTHAIRSSHDGILIGGRTLLVDNPRLTNRLWGEAANRTQPRPIVLDTHLDYIRQMGDSCRVENMIACCSQEAADSFESIPPSIQILPCEVLPDGRLNLHDVLAKLFSRFGIKSVMVEGGAAVLSSFFDQGPVDCLCVTIAPRLLGQGLAPSYANACFAEGENGLRLTPSRFCVLGTDSIFIKTWSGTKPKLNTAKK